MPRSEKKKSKGLGKITGRSVEVRAPAAAEPRLCRIDTSHFHPFFASLAGIESHVDCMAEFVGDVVSQQLCVVIRTSINLDPVFVGDGHGANAMSRSHKDDVVLKLQIGRARVGKECRSRWTPNH